MTACSPANRQTTRPLSVSALGSNVHHVNVSHHLLLIFAIAALAAALAAPPTHGQYLTLGGDDMDACSSNGVVAGLKAGGGDFLVVRAGPGSSHAEIDRLRDGEAVFLCTSAGEWHGVVYGGGRECDVSSPIVPAQIYLGPCKSGWVQRHFIAVTAG